MVVGKVAVAGQRRELGEQRVDVVVAMRPVGVPRDLAFPPGRQVLVEVAQQRRRPCCRARRPPSRRPSPRSPAPARAVPRPCLRSRRAAFRTRDSSSRSPGRSPRYMPSGGRDATKRRVRAARAPVPAIMDSMRGMTKPVPPAASKRLCRFAGLPADLTGPQPRAGGARSCGPCLSPLVCTGATRPACPGNSSAPRPCPGACILPCLLVRASPPIPARVFSGG